MRKVSNMSERCTLHSTFAVIDRNRLPKNRKFQTVKLLQKYVAACFPFALFSRLMSTAHELTEGGERRSRYKLDLHACTRSREQQVGRLTAKTRQSRRWRKENHLEV